MTKEKSDDQKLLSPDQYFHWDCQYEHEVLISICEKAQPNVDEKVYKEFLKDQSPCKCWLAIA